MADEEQIKNPDATAEEGAAPEGEQTLQGGAYEVLRKRLLGLNGNLCEALDKINTKRKEVFGGQESAIIGNERIQTENNCVPRDITGVGDYLIFGYNVFVGLRSETKLEDVFSIHTFDGKEFKETDLTLLSDEGFVREFYELYQFYKSARFLQFIKGTDRLLLIFQAGTSVEDVKIFRFKINKDHSLSYIDNRGDMDYKLPPQHDFEWHPTGREDQVSGEHPHVNILDRVFVECIGGDLTIKIENNTASGEGIYAEPVDNPDQTLDDGQIDYAAVGDLILLRIKPYREDKYRYFIFNEKKSEAVREDSIERACVQLPEDHGIIFPKGYYLQDGTRRQFDEDVRGMEYLESIKSPNGEDFLYIFYHEEQGLHILIQYNLITKKLANPIFCHGYSLYDDGKMVLFNSPGDEPKRIHPMQIWQTPFYADSFDQKPTSDSHYVTIGNRDLVRGVSEGYTISRLVTTDEVTLYIYQDIIKAATNMLDGYHWLSHEEAFGVEKVVQDIKSAAIAAVDEYEKVLRIRENTKKQIAETSEKVRVCLLDSQPDSMTAIDQFVDSLSEIRTLRGHVISLRELRYADIPKIDGLDEKLEGAAELVSNACVEFLLRPDALNPCIQKNEEIAKDLEKTKKIADLKPLADNLEKLAENLDLLTDVVNNLNIDDATKTTQIVDKITDVYAGINRTRATARNLKKDLGKHEAKAEFAAQFKLVSQSITNYIGMCDSVQKCDEFLTKVMVNIEELESHFADFEEYAEQLAAKREEAYAAFTGRKQVLDEERKRKMTSLISSAERILKGVINRAETFKSVDEVNSYFASDLMVSKFRDIIKKLADSGDTVQADDLTGRIKSAKDEISRRLRDKLDLFDEGENTIKFGDYRFTVNTQPLELTTVFKEEQMFFHLTGTDFYEVVDDEEFLKTRDLWQQEIVSETDNVYRGEYLAYKILMAAVNKQSDLTLERLHEAIAGDGKELIELVREFSANLYNEGYEKGVHDHDTAEILKGLVKLYDECLLLRYESTSRGLAIIFWCFYDNEDHKKTLRNKMRSFGTMAHVFGPREHREEYIDDIRQAMIGFFAAIGRDVKPAALTHAAEYLYFELQDQEELEFTINALAQDLHKRFMKHLKAKKVDKKFVDDVKQVVDLKSRVNLVYDWVSTYVETSEDEESHFLIWEVVSLIVAGDVINQDRTSVGTYYQVKDLLGQHPSIQDKCLDIYFDRFLLKLTDFVEVRVPMYDKYVKLRTELTEACREDMRLSEFKPRVMGSFVRNKLINDVYLNLVGANFAKQMGVAGEAKRTDLMGLLLLISPPGYGKTTLMEYISNRLGLTFMKINGPAIGHAVTSLDPAEAPNATAKEELAKLNLSLEMGNNIMIYLDDIQHVNPEFLQKFISLCDAQRKIEGVYKGKTRTYDLRGKKVAVVMAGNPYTESGEKFKIPDMLANRADTYNLGDITSTSAAAFALSFVENAMTSNTVLSSIASHGHEDIYKFADAVARGSSEGIDFNYNYSASEVDEIMNVLKKLFKVRDVVLNVNKQYIYSAAQQDDYRTEPQFKLQGSYRNMNRMAEKVFPVMTDEEVDQVIMDHYYNEAQTLTTGAESNILKYKEMMGILKDEDAERWEQIKGEFNRRQTLAGIDDSDEMGKIIAQLSGFNANMGNIQRTLDSKLDKGLGQLTTTLGELGNKEQKVDLSPVAEAIVALAKKDQKVDLEPVAKAIAAMSKNQQNLKVENKFPEEYVKALVSQGRTIEGLLPVFQEICEHSANYAKLREMLEQLVKGEIAIHLNSGK